MNGTPVCPICSAVTDEQLVMCEECQDALERFLADNNISDDDWDDTPEEVASAILRVMRLHNL